MYYVKECGSSPNTILSRIRSRYGDNFTLVSRRATVIKGFWGFGQRQGWEYTFSISGENDKKTSPSPASKSMPLANSETLERITNLVEAVEERLAARMNRIEQQFTTTPSPAAEEKNDKFSHHLMTMLSYNEFPHKFSLRLINNLSACGNLTTRLDAIHKMGLQLVQMLHFYTPPSFQNTGPRAISLVGSTGSGKTTTLAKMAAQFTLGRYRGRHNTVHIVSLDSYRVGAHQQIETYGKILNLQVNTVKSYPELLRLFEQAGEKELFLIDTIGRNPQESAKLAETQKILSACGEHEVFLLLNSSTSYSTNSDYIRLFSLFRPCSVILTKMDEASAIGPTLAAILEANIPISYITDGQNVANDLGPATPVKILNKVVAPGVTINWSDLIRHQEGDYLIRNSSYFNSIERFDKEAQT